MLHERKFALGEQIFAQDTPTMAIYLVVNGRVKITRVTREGFESILCLRQTGEYFCPVSVLDKGPQLGTAYTMSEATLLWAEREAFCALCETNPEPLSMVQGTCLAEVRYLIHRLEAFTFRNVRERLAIALLAESNRQRQNGEPADEVRLTQQELAGLIRASRESFSRTLKCLNVKGSWKSGEGAWCSAMGNN